MRLSYVYGSRPRALVFALDFVSTFRGDCDLQTTVHYQKLLSVSEFHVLPTVNENDRTLGIGKWDCVHAFVNENEQIGS
jgi:hypothetical protein